MRNITSKTNSIQPASNTINKFKLLSSINVDREPKIACERIYTNFLLKLTTTNNTPKIEGQVSALSHCLPENIWSTINLEYNKHNHINLKSDNNQRLLGGRMLIPFKKWDGPLMPLRTVNTAEISTIVMGGIDFEGYKHFEALRRNLFNFYSGTNYEKDTLRSGKYALYYPLYEKHLRYAELLKLRKNPTYASKEMIEFTLRHVLPKIEREEPLSFFCYSASCREVLMIENVCREYFLQKRLPESEIRRLMSSIDAVMIGYAFDWSVNNDLPGFNKLILLSIEDFGILRPKSNRELIYGASSLETGINCILRAENSLDKVIIFGQDSIPIKIGNRVNHKGHSLPHYVNGFKQHFTDEAREQIMSPTRF